MWTIRPAFGAVTRQWRMPDIDAGPRTAGLLAGHFAAYPFTFGDAMTVVSKRALRTALERGTVVRLRRGVFAVAVRDDRIRYQQRVAAALLTRPGNVASCESGLALLNCALPTFGGTWNSQTVHLTGANAARVRSVSLVVVQRAVPEHHRVETPWGPATSPARTAVDLARVSPFRLALIAADECCALALAAEAGLAPSRGPALRHLVAGHYAEAGELMRAAAAEAPSRVGARRVEAVAASVDPAAESPGESLSRALLLQAGIPRPVVALPLRGDDGRHYVADLAWTQQRVLGEVDGYGKYAGGRDTLIAEKRREDALRAAGWGFVRWTVVEMLTHPDAVVARVRRALRL